MNNQNNQNNEQFFIIRTDRAGVFYARIAERRGSEADLLDTRRMWYWSGAASLSQLATEGVSKPRDCKFTVVVPSMTVLGVIEVIPVSDQARATIEGVPEWRA